MKMSTPYDWYTTNPASARFSILILEFGVLIFPNFPFCLFVTIVSPESFKIGTTTLTLLPFLTISLQLSTAIIFRHEIQNKSCNEFSFQDKVR